MHIDASAAIATIRELATGRSPWAIPAPCLAEFVRVVTHPSIYRPASTIAQATAAIADFMAMPTCTLIGPGEPFARLLSAAIEEGNAAGNRVFDAQIAAICREHGVYRRSSA